MTAPGTQAPPAPGWYADPVLRDTQRWWTGARWGEHVRPTPTIDGVELLIPRTSTLATRALVWGIVAAILPVVVLPGILAVVFGAIALPREQEAARRGQPARVGRAAAGLILGIVSLVLLAGTIAAMAYFSRG